MTPHRSYLLDQIQHDILMTMPFITFVYRQDSETDYRVVWMSHLAAQVTGFSDVLEQRVEAFMVPSEAARIIALLQRCCATQEPIVVEDIRTVPAGKIWSRMTYQPLPHRPHVPPHVLVIAEDITARKQRELEERAQQESIIAQQQATLAELSTPLLAISNDTVVMPIIGSVDSHRIQQIMDVLLTGVSSARARTVILDITGVPVVDTQVANALIRASQAVKLLGAQVILTGIRPEVAQTLVGIGIDFAGLITLATLQTGITYALASAAHAGSPPVDLSRW